MNIEIRTLAKQNKVKLPDLLTRPVGRAIYASARKKIAYAGDDETIVFDFDGIQVIDPSFVDEFIINLLKTSTEGKHYYIRVKNVSKSAELNIRSVMESYMNYGEKKYAVLTEDLTSENNHVIGFLTAEQIDVIELMRINKTVTVDQIQNALTINGQQCKEILEEMCSLRIIRKNEHAYTLV